MQRRGGGAVKPLLLWILIVCAMAPAQALPAAAVQGADEPVRRTTLLAGPAFFARDGETYRLTLRATDDPRNTDSVTMTIRRTRDPDGAARSRQAHSRQFEAADTVTASDNLDQAAVDTAGKIAPHGEVDLEFTATRPPQEASCYGADRTIRRGRVKGTLRFSPGGRFGDVVVTSMKARLDSVEGTCGPGTGTPPGSPVPSCPPAGQSLWWEDGRFLGHAFKPAGRAALVVYASRERTLDMDDSSTDGYLTDNLVARLPRSHGAFAQDLFTARVRGEPGTDVRRRVSFEASTPMRRVVTECTPTQETVERRRRGTITGTLRFDFVIGPDVHLDGRRLAARVERRTVRPLE